MAGRQVWPKTYDSVDSSLYGHRLYHRDVRHDLATVDGGQDDECASLLISLQAKTITRADRLQGFSVGINQAMLMTYISEIAPTQVCTASRWLFRR